MYSFTRENSRRASHKYLIWRFEWWPLWISRGVRFIVIQLITALATRSLHPQRICNSQLVWMSSECKRKIWLQGLKITRCCRRLKTLSLRNRLPRFSSTKFWKFHTLYTCTSITHVYQFNTFHVQLTFTFRPFLSCSFSYLPPIFCSFPLLPRLPFSLQSMKEYQISLWVNVTIMWQYKVITV